MSGLIWKGDQKSYTKQDTEAVKFEWIIDNFSQLNIPTGGYIKSSIFNSTNIKWYLRLFPNGYSHQSQEFLSLSLNIQECAAGKQINATFKFLVLNIHNKVVFEKSGKEMCWTKFLLISDLLDKSKGYLNDDKLKLGVELKIYADIQTIPNVIIGGEESDSEAVADYMEFMNDKSFSDVTIVNSIGEELYAHRVFLAKHSIVFANMLQTDMKEKRESRITIPNISPQALQQMLHYIYSGKIENADNIELIQDLIPASDEFQIIPLKKMCEKILINNLSPQNVLEFFKYAEFHQCETLKEASIQFIEFNKDSILQSPEWEDFLAKNVRLGNQVIMKLTKVCLKRKASELDK